MYKINRNEIASFNKLLFFFQRYSYVANGVYDYRFLKNALLIQINFYYILNLLSNLMIFFFLMRIVAGFSPPFHALSVEALHLS